MYFVLKEGEIASQHDRDIHFISNHELRRLYQVPLDANIVDENFIKRNRPDKTEQLFIILEPQYFGDYNLFNAIEKQVLFTYKPMWEDMATRKYRKMTFWKRLKFLFKGE